MLGLAIDSADRTASAALFAWGNPDGHSAGSKSGSGRKMAGGRLVLLAEGALPPEAGKADQLITVIARLLDDCELDYADLDVIAVNCGPGSFTGIRSAVALGRGLALAAGLPVLSVTSHEALAARLNDGGSACPLLIALDARRGEVYVQTFAADGQPMTEIEAKAPVVVAAGLEPGRWRLAGSGAGLIAEAAAREEITWVETRPVDAADIALAAVSRLSAGEAPIDGFALRPLYIRAPDAVPPTPLMPKAAASGVRV